LSEWTEKDRELVESAREVIRKNYDDRDCNHTVGAAIRCKNGKIYTGVNVYSLHGACAEQVAIGAAITAGEREFETIVAVRGRQGEEVIPPCGNCRQILCDYMPECAVLLAVGGKPCKVRAKELLPFAYCFEG
jgi:cytidine deaminase